MLRQQWRSIAQTNLGQNVYARCEMWENFKSHLFFYAASLI